MRIYLLQLLFRLAASLSDRAVQFLASAVGQLLYRIPNRERRNARVNIRLCCPQLNQTEQDQLVRQTLIDNARTLIEMPGAWSRDPEYWLGRIVGVESEQLPRQALAAGKGLIVAAPHLGAWEVGVHSIARIGPMTVLYRPPREAWLKPLMFNGRRRSGATLVPTDTAGIKALYQALKRGETITILPDQQPKSSSRGAGVFAPFFGVPALTMTLISRLARKSGAPVVFVFFQRLPGRAGYRGHWLPAPEGIDAADPEIAAAALNQGVENCVAVCPAQYQWTYKRFDRRPDGAPSPYAAPD